MTTSKIALVTLSLLLSTGASIRPTIAASTDEKPWPETWLVANGACVPGGGYNIAAIMTTEMWGKPLLEISDDDIATATRAYRSCIANCEAEWDRRSLARSLPDNLFHDKFISQCLPQTVLRVGNVDKFELALRNAVMAARNVDNQKKAQQVAAIELEKAQLREQAQRDKVAAEEAVRLEAAQIEVEKAEAQRKRDQAEKDAQRKQEQMRQQTQRDREAAEEARQQQQASVEFEKAQAKSRLAQAEDDAHRKQEQLREQAQRDREAAEATARLAEREEPKIAEATREAEAARQARHAAEQRLAEIRSRMEAQETARKQQADQDAAEQKQKAAQEAAAARQKAAQEAAEQKRQVAQETAAQANLPINILGAAYASYVDVKRCQEARDGYAAIYISNPEMDQARNAVQTIEQTMKSKLDQNTTTDDVWSRVATTEGRNFRPSGDYQEGTRMLCRERLALLLSILREHAPERGTIKKDF